MHTHTQGYWNIRMMLTLMSPTIPVDTTWAQVGYERDWISHEYVFLFLCEFVQVRGSHLLQLLLMVNRPSLSSVMSKLCSVKHPLFHYYPCSFSL